MFNIRLPYVLSALVALIFFGLILVGMMVPLYSDESAVKLMQASVITNDGRLVALTPQCNSGLTLPIPASWYPAAGIYQLIFQDRSPLMVRTSGVVVALSFVLLVALGLKRFVSNRLPYEYVLVGWVASLGVGIIPLTLILSRSEQWMLLCLSYFIFLPLIYEHKGTRKILPGLLFITFVACTSLFFYTHPKSIFFFPVVVVSGWVAFRGLRILQLCAVVFSFVCVAQTFMMAKEIANCANAPMLASINASQTLDVFKLISQPTLLVELFYTYLTTFPAKAVQYTIFRSAYPGAWLPALLPQEGLSVLTLFVNRLISIFLHVLLVAGLVLPVITIAIAALRRMLGRLHLMLAVVWFSVVVHLVVYVNWNFYAVSLVICVSILLVLFSVVDIPWPKSWRILGYSFIFSVCSVFVLSAIVNFSTLAPRLAELVNLESGFGIPDQPGSIQTFRYPEQRDKIKALASICGVAGDGATHLVIDDLTFFSFQNLRAPLHLAYISEKGGGQDIKDVDFIPFLNRLNSPGVIGRCSLFPNSTRSRAIEMDGLCCLKL